MTRKLLLVTIGTVVLPSASGCVNEVSEGTTRTYTYELWVPLSVLFLGIILATAGWFLRENPDRFGRWLLGAGAIVAIFAAPSLFRDRAVVDDKAFSLRTGIWGLTAVRRVEFDNLAQVRIISKQRFGRRGTWRTQYYLVCEGTDGRRTRIPLSNKVAEAASVYFLEKVAQRGIPIRDET